MTIFDQLRDIVQTKQNLLEEDCDLEREFVPFMTQRWLSFYSNQFTMLMNGTTNSLWKSFDDKQLYYKLFLGVVPKCRNQRIKYIKKNKEHAKKQILDKDMITYLAERFELSRADIKEYLESGVVDVKLLKKQLNNK